MKKAGLFFVVFLLCFCLNVTAKKSFYLSTPNAMDCIVRLADHPKGTIILLHGWNFSPTEWCEKSSICDSALKRGYNLILPNLGKSTYHWQTYPETRKDYLKYPTRKWMYDSLFVYLQKSFSVLKAGQNNFVAGISTGGRGAALFALEHPELFKAAVCLSADFDQSLLKGEPINTGFYGPFEKFPDRWKGKDNIYNRASELKVPLLLIHGKKDKMCPYTQSESFYAKISMNNNPLGHQIILSKNDGHTYAFWSAQSEIILNFFDQHLH